MHVLVREWMGYTRDSQSALFSGSFCTVTPQIGVLDGSSLSYADIHLEKYLYMRDEHPGSSKESRCAANNWFVLTRLNVNNNRGRMSVKFVAHAHMEHLIPTALD